MRSLALLVFHAAAVTATLPCTLNMRSLALILHAAAVTAMPNASALASFRYNHRNCCAGRTYRIGLGAMSYPPLWNYDPAASPPFSGYIVDILSLYTADMGFTIQWVPMQTIDTNPLTFLNPLMDTPSWLDVILAPQSPEGFNKFDHSHIYFTTTFKESMASGLVNRSATASSPFRLFEPMGLDLWAAIVGSITISALLIVLINTLLRPPTSASSSVSEEGDKATSGPLAAIKGGLVSFIQAFYHAWAFLLGGEDIEWPSAPAKLLRLALLFLVLILASTYTANLAAFFNKPSFTIGGPKNYDELRVATACQPFLLGQQAVYEQFVGSIIGPPDDLPFDPIATRLDWCVERLRSGEVDIVLYDRPILLNYLFTDSTSSGSSSSSGGRRLSAASRAASTGNPSGSGKSGTSFIGKCSSLSDASWVQILPDNWMFALRSEDAHFGAMLSASVSAAKFTPAMLRLQEQYFYAGKTCGDASVSDTTPVTLPGMLGLFYISGGMAVAAVLLAMLQRLTLGPMVDADAGSLASNGEMLRAIIEKVDRLEQMQQKAPTSLGC